MIYCSVSSPQLQRPAKNTTQYDQPKTPHNITSQKHHTIWPAKNTRQHDHFPVQTNIALDGGYFVYFLLGSLQRHNFISKHLIFFVQPKLLHVKDSMCINKECCGLLISEGHLCANYLAQRRPYHNKKDRTLCTDNQSLKTTQASDMAPLQLELRGLNKCIVFKWCHTGRWPYPSDLSLNTQALSSVLFWLWHRMLSDFGGWLVCFGCKFPTSNINSMA